MKPTPKKKGISPQTFNMLVFAGTLILAISLIVLFHILATMTKEKETSGEADGMETPSNTDTSYYLNNLWTGPLAIPSPSHPWSQAQVDAVFPTLIPLKNLSPNQEEPYQMAKNNLFAKADAVMALHALALASPYPIVIEHAYLPYDTGNGTSPLHTGYAFQLSSPSQGVREWLQEYAHLHGFVLEGDLLLYVTPPHARAIYLQKTTLEAYVASLTGYTCTTPYLLKDGACTYTTFYLPAHHGTATFTLKEKDIFIVSGDGEKGFIITLLVFSPSI